MPRKRKVGGRVTPRKVPGGGVPAPRGPEDWKLGDLRSSVPSRSGRQASGPGQEPAASARYTPRSRPVRIRPGWHRRAGWIGLALGILVAVLNDMMLVSGGTLLPFGHSEAWLFLGITIAAGSTWFLGLFDRGTTIYQ